MTVATEDERAEKVLKRQVLEVGQETSMHKLARRGRARETPVLPPTHPTHLAPAFSHMLWRHHIRILPKSAPNAAIQTIPVYSWIPRER